MVVLRNWDSLHTVNFLRESGLRQALVDNSPRIVETYPEELDSMRFGTMKLRESVLLLHAKYRDVPIDVVIPSGLDTLRFAVEHRDLVWPGAAIVFNGVPEGQLEGWQRPPRTTGVTMELDVEGTLRAGLALVPGARRVYFFSGTGEFDKGYLQLALAHAARLKQRLDIHVVTDITNAEMVRRAEQIEPDSLVVWLTVLRDSAGEFAVPDSDAVTRVVRASRAPVLSAVHTQWSRGPLGGSSAKFDEHGRLAGQLVRQVLAGADPDSIDIRPLPRATCEIDWRGLQRWNLAARAVPAECRIVNRPPQTLRDNIWLLAGLTAVVLLQTALIWMLVLQSRRRRTAERQVIARNAELARAGRMSMLGALTASIAHEINQPMGAILSNTEAAETMLARGELDQDTLREILADIRREDLRAAEVITSVRKLVAQHHVVPVALELNDEVAHALGHVAFDAAKHGVTLLPVFHPETPAVVADAAQLHQVVINLALNAIQAVSDQPQQRRIVNVTTRPAPGGAEIEVADRGPGVAPEHVDHIAESMFTTKGDGMGLGLTIVRTIVESFGGRVRYQPNEPHGARFLVWLPSVGR